MLPATTRRQFSLAIPYEATEAFVAGLRQQIIDVSRFSPTKQNKYGALALPGFSTSVNTRHNHIHWGLWFQKKKHVNDRSLDIRHPRCSDAGMAAFLRKCGLNS